ncbi:HET domain-containing protein [Pochonia chlamydosporia 170]|uniref:HET domain-containing protein n=1 Tax=Pochonia chlamydosporia 170 TaxID=1380566 RepID=A0A179F3G6_METCM|nr:HET domain-containing protein [Pochonia chlamydosporia 170]OAQ59955.1 HET domain-containing protein [Pochonia chlamydosporia 170]
MRLINTTTRELESFPEDTAPPYAILSHTWGDDADELSYIGMRDGKVDKRSPGWAKLRGCCQRAKLEGIHYAWIDTCCIDKTNLVELSEAINSMFRWYRKSSICFVYLSDVPDDDKPRLPQSGYRCSRWFQRGWTLQELLAPKKMKFYTVGWNYLGTKAKLHGTISSITGIPSEVLLGVTSVQTACVAQRMSWAARRETKRKEDTAYCLLGIFNISMPLVYGEGGDHAFFRLQEQILKHTRDDSILAWGITDTITVSLLKKQRTVRILAVAPSEFANSGNVVVREPHPCLETISVAAGGIRISLPLRHSHGETYLGLLGCKLQESEESSLEIPLCLLPSGEYARAHGSLWRSRQVKSLDNKRKLVYITNNVQDKSADGGEDRYFIYDEAKFAQAKLELVEVFPQTSWCKDSSMFTWRIKSDRDYEGEIWARFRYPDPDAMNIPDFVVLLGFKPTATTPRCCVLICDRNSTIEYMTSHRDIVREYLYEYTCATNGFINLGVTLKIISETTVNILPEIMPQLPMTTINLTAEMDRVVQNFLSIMRTWSAYKRKAEI